MYILRSADGAQKRQILSRPILAQYSSVCKGSDGGTQSHKGNLFLPALVWGKVFSVAAWFTRPKVASAPMNNWFSGRNLCCFLPQGHA